MLILTRRIGESLVIGEKIIVTVLGIHGNQVRIGVTAPKEIPIYREEVYQRISQENRLEEREPSADNGAENSG